MWSCPICSREAKSEYVCPYCGYDECNDFVMYRTVCKVPSVDLNNRKSKWSNEPIETELSIPIGQMQKSIHESVGNFARILRQLALQKTDLRQEVHLQKVTVPKTYNVELTSVGISKLPVIVAVRQILGYGLKETKELVDNVPSIIKIGVSKEEAETIKHKVEVLGAKVTIIG